MKFNHLLIIFMFFASSKLLAQTELWQLQPWAPNDQWVVGADSTGEPMWVGLTEIQIPDSLMFVDEGICYVDTIKLRQGGGFIPLYDNDVSRVFIHTGGLEELGESPEDIQINFENYTVNRWDCGGTWEFMFYLPKRYVAGYGLNETENTSTYYDPFVTFDIDTSIISTRYYLDSIITTVGGGTIDGVGVANKVALWATTDSLTYDSLYFNPTNHILGIGTDSPTATGGSFGHQIHGGSFSSLRLTNTTTGALGTDGTSIYTYLDSLYLVNLENAPVIIGTNSVERGRFDSAGFRVSALASGGSAPTTSGTLAKVVTDANGRLSFQTNNTGTVTSVGLSTGTSGTDVNVSGSPVTSSGTITLNIPTASAINRGALSSTDWSTFNNKFDLPALTSGSVLFSNGTTIAQNNTKLFWNNSTERLGIGTASPTMPLHVEGRGYFNQGSSNLFLNGGNTTLSGSSNFALGGGTLTALTTGFQNVGIGVGAAPALTTGYANFALGSQSLNACQGCYGNIAIGNQSLFTNISGFRNVAIGQEALAFTTTDASTAVGFYALRGQTTGLYNTGVGYFAAYQNTTGSGNVSSGFFSGPVGGSNNTIYGYYAGSGTTGDANVIIGNQAGGGTLTQSNKLYIANSGTTTPLIGGDFSTGKVSINGSASPVRTLHVTGEMRVTDLTTDTPTQIVGADADGDFGAMTTGNGVTVSAGQVGLTGQALAVHNLASNGLIARTGSGTVAARTIENGQGVLVTNGDGVSGNPSLFNVVCSHGQLYNTGNLSSQTLDATPREIDFTSSYSNNMTLSTAGNSITIPATGTYEITYSFSYSTNASGSNSVYFELYRNGSTYGYNGQTRNKTTEAGTGDDISTVHRSIIGDFTNADTLEMYYYLFSGSSTTIDFFNLNFTAKRLK